MDTKIEDHTNFITDIRFKTNSTQLATSSSDGTVRLWNAADVSNSYCHISARSFTKFYVIVRWMPI
jgi:WD40 repeat protein